MRIITGKYRGRTIIGPKSNVTRPITDRAKQSLFDALVVALDFTDMNALDCFSGTGSMGLECLSRGAAKSIFIEQDYDALQALRNNLRHLGVIHAHYDVLAMNAYSLAHAPAVVSDRLGAPAGASGPGRLRLAFIDPPYAHLADPAGRVRVSSLVLALAHTAMEPTGLFVVRHSVDNPLDDLPIGTMICRRLNYGSMAVTWLAADKAPPCDMAAKTITT